MNVWLKGRRRTPSSSMMMTSTTGGGRKGPPLNSMTIAITMKMMHESNGAPPGRSHNRGYQRVPHSKLIKTPLKIEIIRFRWERHSPDCSNMSWKTGNCILRSHPSATRAIILFSNKYLNWNRSPIRSFTITTNILLHSIRSDFEIIACIWFVWRFRMHRFNLKVVMICLRHAFNRRNVLGTNV